MARRITFRRPAPRAWFEDADSRAPPLKLATWHALESQLGRPLADTERDRVACAIGSARSWRALAQRSVSTEDVKATLAALAKCPADEAPQAFENCDVVTRAFLFDALMAAGLRGAAVLDADGEQVKAAAAHALATLPAPRRGPRLTWRRLLADDAMRLWQDFGGAAYAPAATASRDYATPLVRFAVALFAEVETKTPAGLAGLLATVAKAQRDK